jgi:hypothetical protein
MFWHYFSVTSIVKIEMKPLGLGAVTL